MSHHRTRSRATAHRLMSNVFHTAYRNVFPPVQLYLLLYNPMHAEHGRPTNGREPEHSFKVRLPQEFTPDWNDVPK